MTEIGPSAHEFVPWLLGLGAWFLAGSLIGGFHFLSLKGSVGRFAAGGALALPIGIQLARFALTAAALVGIVKACGAIPLLLGTAGIWIARTAIVRAGVHP